MADIIILQERWCGYVYLSNYHNFKGGIIILQPIEIGPIVRATE